MAEDTVVEGDNSEYVYDEEDACDSDEVDAILEDFCGKSVSESGRAYKSCLLGVLPLLCLSICLFLCLSVSGRL